MARFTSVSQLDKTYTYSLWLIFGDDGNVRLTRGEPDLARGERGMQMQVTLPWSLFATPALKASIAVPDALTTVPPIDLTVARDALKDAIGVDVDLKIIPPEPLDGGES